MSEHREPIPSMIYNAAVGGHVTNSQQIIDENENKEQSQINAEVKQTLGQGGSVDNRIIQAKNDIIENASSNGNTLKKIEDRVSPLETAVGTGGNIDVRIANAVNIEKTRAEREEQLLQEQYNALTQSDIEVGTLPASGTKNKIYRVPGTNTYSDYMWNGSSFVKMAEYDNAIDNEPTTGSNNLVKSGGVFKTTHISNCTYINDNIIDKLDGNTAYIKSFNVFLGSDEINYQTIPAQTVTTTPYSCVYLVYSNGSFKSTLECYDTNSTRQFDNGNIYIPLFTMIYGRVSWTKWSMPFMEFPENAMSIANATSGLGTNRYFGEYQRMTMRVKGFQVNLCSVTSSIKAYMLDMDTEVLTLIEEFSTSELAVGVQSFIFSSVQMIGGKKQLIINGDFGFSYVSGNDVLWQHTLIEYDYANKRILSIGSPTFFIPIRLLLDIDYFDGTMKHQPIQLTDAICSAGNSNLDLMRETKLSYNLSEYDDANAYSYAIGPYIPYNCEVTKISVNVCDISKDIKVYKIDIQQGTYELLKTVTPEATGTLDITLDSIVQIKPMQQIGLTGGFGYKHNPSAGLPLYNYFYWDFDIKQIKYKVQLSLNINTVEFGIKFTFKRPIELQRAQNYFNNNVIGEIIDFKKDIQNIIGEYSYETIVVNIKDYDNNLQNVFDAINPTPTKHYTILIPEGTYNVNEWFTQSQIENSNETQWRGLELLNYTKLLGLGATDKVILQWLNSDEATHWSYISTLNTNHWHELENLTIKANNIRYCVHDDIWDGHDRYLRVKNCRFESYNNVSRAWGAGCNGGYDAIFENCHFIMHYYAPYDVDAIDNYIEPFVLHDNQYNVGRDSHLVFKNCRFYVPYTNIKYSMEANRASWQEIAYNSNYQMYDNNKTDYAINDCVNMPDNIQYSYKCLYANSKIPPYMIGRPSINVGFGWENTTGVLYLTVEGCATNTYIAVPSKQTRVTGFGNKFGEEPILWNEGTDDKDIIYDLLS